MHMMSIGVIEAVAQSNEEELLLADFKMGYMSFTESVFCILYDPRH